MAKVHKGIKARNGADNMSVWRTKAADETKFNSFRFCLFCFLYLHLNRAGTPFFLLESVDPVFNEAGREQPCYVQVLVAYPIYLYIFLRYYYVYIYLRSFIIYP